MCYVIVAFPWKTCYGIHSNEVQIMNMGIGRVIQKTNGSVYNQTKGSGFHKFLFMIITLMLITGLPSYRLNFNLCQYIYCLFLAVFCHKRYCQISGQGK